MPRQTLLGAVERLPYRYLPLGSLFLNFGAVPSRTAMQASVFWRRRRPPLAASVCTHTRHHVALHRRHRAMRLRPQRGGGGRPGQPAPRGSGGRGGQSDGDDRGSGGRGGGVVAAAQRRGHQPEAVRPAAVRQALAVGALRQQLRRAAGALRGMPLCARHPTSSPLTRRWGRGADKHRESV